MWSRLDRSVFIMSNWLMGYDHNCCHKINAKTYQWPASYPQCIVWILKKCCVVNILESLVIFGLHKILPSCQPATKTKLISSRTRDYRGNKDWRDDTQDCILTGGVEVMRLCQVCCTASAVLRLLSSERVMQVCHLEGWYYYAVGCYAYSARWNLIG